MRAGSHRFRPVFLLSLCAALSSTVQAQDCDTPALVQNHSGGGQVVCPCFGVGEEAGAVLLASSVATDSLDVVRVGIAWGSQFGGAPQSLEQAIHVYASGLPAPGTPAFTLPGPLLNDGFINEFDLEAFGGPVRLANAPFMVSLEFLNPNAGDFFAPSMVHDGNGCQPGRNAVLVGGTTWTDACVLNVSGDWLIYAVVRPVCSATGVPLDEVVAANRPVFLGLPSPNPVSTTTAINYVLREPGTVDIGVYDLRGRKVASLVEGSREAGLHVAIWDGRSDEGTTLPAGTYFVLLRSEHGNVSRRVALAR